jgi:hypothetical protein
VSPSPLFPYTPSRARRRALCFVATAMKLLPRVLHNCAIFVHFGITVACCVLATRRDSLLFGGKLPLVCLDTATGDPERRMFGDITVVEACHTYDIVAVCICMHLITMAAHIVYRFTEKRRYLRWAEYAVTAPLVFTNLAITTGIREVTTLVLIVACITTIMPFGAFATFPVERLRHAFTSLSHETQDTAVSTEFQFDEDASDDAVLLGEDGTFGDRGTATALTMFRAEGLSLLQTVQRLQQWAQVPAYAAFGMVMGIIITQFVQLAEAVPDFVWAIFFLQCCLLPSFAIVSVLEFIFGMSPAKADLVYTALSLCSKVIPTAIFLSAIADT